MLLLLLFFVVVAVCNVVVATIFLFTDYNATATDKKNTVCNAVAG